MNKDKEETRGGGQNFLVHGSTIDIMIRRNYIYEDAFEKLSPENEPELKKGIRVQLVNAVGMDEAGECILIYHCVIYCLSHLAFWR